MRFIFVTLGTVFLILALITMARIWGLGQTYPPYEHAFFATQGPLVIVQADTISAIDETLKIKPDAVIWLDVRISKDQVPFILPASEDIRFLKNREELQAKSPQTPIFIGGKLSEYPFEQINEFFKTTPSLKEIYEKYKGTRFVLNVIDNVADVHTLVVAAVEGQKPDERTFVQSDALVVITAIKELKPMWIFGTSYPDIMRLLSFESLYLLPATQFKGDVFVSPFKVMKRPAISDGVIEEMRRRNKRIILGPVDTEEEFKKASDLKVDGYITSNLPQLLKWLK
jgi:glycerophosphoryl diester phosphodiesterase